MKISLVCPYSLDIAGGVGSHVLGLAHWLTANGYQPQVIAPGNHPITADFPIWLLGSSVRLPFNGSTARLAVRSDQRRRAIALAADSDLVHVHEPLTPGIGYSSAKRAKRLVVTHHANFKVPGLLSLALRARANHLGRRISIAVSPAALDTVQNFGVQAELIPNAIALPQHRQKPETQSVLFLGRKEDPRKGYQLYRRLRSRLAGIVQFTELSSGTASRAEVEDALNRATILFAPNLGGESFGLILAEALSFGTGIVASALPAFRAVIDDDKVVSWFPPGDLAAAETALLARLAAGVDVDAARKAANRFSWEKVGPQIVRNYELAMLG